MRVYPDNKNIVYSGRMDFKNPKEPRFDWPGVSFTMRFTGKKIWVMLEGGNNDYNCFIDGKLKKIIKAVPEKHMYLISGKIPRGKHKAVITKRTEGYDGIGTFKGFMLDVTGKVLPPLRKKTRKFLFIGDSITVGYGVEGPGIKCDSERKYKNNYKAFSAVLAREAGADFHIIAISGRGLVKNYGEKTKKSKMPMPKYFHSTLMNEPGLKWDHEKFKPGLIFINLGTNDYSAKPIPDGKVFIKEYLKLIKKARKYYKKAEIFCISGPAQSKPYYSYMEKVEQKTKDAKVHFISVKSMSECEFGCDWHPNVKAAKRIAHEIYGQIEQYL